MATIKITSVGSGLLIEDGNVRVSLFDYMTKVNRIADNRLEIIGYGRDANFTYTVQFEKNIVIMDDVTIANVDTLQDAIVEIKKKSDFVEYRKTAAFFPKEPIPGVCIAINTTSFEADGANYEVDAYANSVVGVSRNGQTQYAIIASNTSNIITLSQETIWNIEDGDTFQILDTVWISSDVSDFPQIYALYPENFSGALVVPLVVSELERRNITFYIESLKEGEKIIVISQPGQGFFRDQYRWFELNNDKETLEISGHFKTSKLHWDIIGSSNTKRYQTANVGDFLLANNTSDQLIPAASSEVTRTRRFQCRTVDGVLWCEYTSLLENYFVAEFHATIQKVGGGAGDCEIGWYKFISETGLTEKLNLFAETRFGAGEGKQSISVSQPVLMSYGDRLAPYINRTGGTITLLEGSNRIISEL